MEESKSKICRLCLSFEDDNFLNLEAPDIGKIKAIIPELTLSLPNNTHICSKCRDVLEKVFQLKKLFSKNNDTIQSEKDKSGSDSVDLTTIVNGQGKSVCRICFKRTDERLTAIDKENSDDFNNVLNLCVPELDIKLSAKPEVCTDCHNTLYEMYNFKKDCLAVEEKIQSCYGSAPQDIDLSRVLAMTRSEEENENDFLSGFEVQDEEGTDIFDNIPNATENRKRPAPETEDPEAKKQKLMVGEITTEELPPFHFDVSLLYNPNKSNIMVEDWLNRVDEYKNKFNWSDYTTIHKVLVKLKDMRELYIWFSNIADIMDWEQWKKKLVRAFPRKTDYHIHIKKLLARRKRKEETYVTYYVDKVKLMEPLNLTSEQKVSCIFGGITDVLVCCVGRVGDYQTPEELLDYFKSCDDKQAVETAANGGTKDAKSPDKPKGNANQWKKPFAPASPEKKKAKKRCFECKRFGHTVAECRQYNIGAHLDWMDKVKTQGSPKPNQAQAKRPNAKKIRSAKCLNCFKFGHMQNACPMLHNTNPGASNQPQPIHGNKKLDKRKPGGGPPGGPRQPKQEGSDWTRCRDCGRFGSKSSPCCSVRASFSSGNYIGSYTGQPGANNRDICLRCYRTGHQTKDCNSFASRRGYKR